MRPEAGETVAVEAAAGGSVRDVRELILAATARIIRERGLGGATTKAIAEEARCAEGSIYRYFPNKDALFIECVKEGFPEFIQMVGTLPELAGKGSARHHLEELVKAARLALEGKAVIHPSLTRAFIEEVQYLDRRPDTPLSRREAEILQMVAYGATTKEVAHDLAISPHTVKTHLERIFEKLGANDRAQAVAIAIRRGIVE